MRPFVLEGRERKLQKGELEDKQPAFPEHCCGFRTSRALGRFQGDKLKPVGESEEAAVSGFQGRPCKGSRHRV